MTVLCPVLDMLNHSVYSQLGWPKIENGDLVLRTIAPVAANTQVYLYYGPLPCAHTLQYYGFIDSYMLKYEMIQLVLEPPEGFAVMDGPNISIVDTATEELERCGGKSLSAARAAVLASLPKIGTVHYLREAAELPPQLVSAARICALGWDGVEKIGLLMGTSWMEKELERGSKLDFFTAECELRAGLLLKVMIEALLPEFSETDIRADDGEIDTSISMLIEFQRRIVLQALELVEVMIGKVH